MTCLQQLKCHTVAFEAHGTDLIKATKLRPALQATLAKERGAGGGISLPIGGEIPPTKGHPHQKVEGGPSRGRPTKPATKLRPALQATLAKERGEAVEVSPPIGVETSSYAKSRNLPYAERGTKGQGVGGGRPTKPATKLRPALQATLAKERGEGISVPIGTEIPPTQKPHRKVEGGPGRGRPTKPATHSIIGIAELTGESERTVARTWRRRRRRGKWSPHLCDHFPSQETPSMNFPRRHPMPLPWQHHLNRRRWHYSRSHISRTLPRHSL